MKRFFKLAGSLRLTVALLLCSMAIVFFGTLDQVDWGVGMVQKQYFESLFAAYPISAHSWGDWSVLGAFGRFLADSGFRIPMPGGFLIGGLLLVNLVAAHFRYFKPGWKRAGIAITHAGVLLLVVSGFATAFFQKESITRIVEGGSSDWSQDFQRSEIALTDTTDPAKDRVTVVPDELIRDGSTRGLYPVPGSDVEIRVHRFMANSGIIGPMQAAQFPEIKPVKVDNGVAARTPILVVDEPETFSPNRANFASAVVEVVIGGKSLGTWFVTTFPMGSFGPQPFSYAGKNYELSLRMRRTYFRNDPGETPFSLRLKKFTHEVYAGTATPKNFASDITLEDPREAASRDITISMNKPLRHAGFTFYQASFGSTQGENGPEDITALQVVQNPSYILPYLAVALVGGGMIVHFLITLSGFIGGQKKKGIA